MALLLILLLLALIFVGAGFAVHLLWIVAVVCLIALVIGFVMNRGRGRTASRV
jgi:hypothetical protein